LWDAKDDDARENDHEHEKEGPRHLSYGFCPVGGGLGLIKAHVFQRQRAEREGQRDHPVTVLELRRHRVVVENDDLAQDVEANRMRQPDRATDDEGVRQLQELLIKIVLAGQHFDEVV
jgi:hypothetical protein